MFEDVPGSFCGTSSSSSESMGLCFFAFGKSGVSSSLRPSFSFPSGFVDFLFLVATLNGHSRDLVVSPQLLTYHRYISVHVQVLVLAIWIFVVFRSYQSLHQVLRRSSWITIGRIGGTGGVCGTGIGGVCGVVSVAFVVESRHWWRLWRWYRCVCGVRKDAHDHAIWTVVVVSSSCGD